MARKNAEKFINAERTIYMIENKKNGKRYIGMTIDFERRKKSHYYDLRKNRHVNSKLQKDFDSGRWEDFEFRVLKKVKGLEQAAKEENRLIEYYDTVDNGYNTIRYARPSTDYKIIITGGEEKWNQLT